MARGHRIRVLLLTHELSRTGAPRLALQIFSGLGSQIDLHTVSLEDGPLRADFGSLGRTSILGYGLSRGYRAPVGWLKAWLVRISVKLWRPGVIYVNTVLALPRVDTIKTNAAVVILHVHESNVALAVFDAAHPGLIQSVPDSYIAVSQNVADALAVAYSIPTERIRVVPPFVSIPKDVRRRQVDGADASAFVVGGMGNPSWTKGLTLWLLAAREVVDQAPGRHVRFRWVGLRENMIGHQFRAMAHKLRLDDVVEFMSETTDPIGEIGRFDVLAMSSWEESASLVTLEAMANRVPVICFKGSGGPAEEVGGAGVVLPAFSASALATAIIELQEHPDQRAALAEAGLARVAAAYTATVAIPAIAEVIAKAGAQHAR
jgi:glycosyltransferase involved in cell wall biosynthesis